ncbi:MAG: hypothetical protein QOJ86_4519 [Bradyrhizobium sp.]|jgi:hypothetical protein|nr:hypothetical protein [Bradyrhizobium sp.]
MRVNSPSGFKNLMLICLGIKGMGETMNIQIRHPAMYPVSRRALAIQDFLMVSAFGIWALVLGLSPVLVFHALT